MDDSSAGWLSAGLARHKSGGPGPGMCGLDVAGVEQRDAGILLPKP